MGACSIVYARSQVAEVFLNVFTLFANPCSTAAGRSFLCGTLDKQLTAFSMHIKGAIVECPCGSACELGYVMLCGSMPVVYAVVQY